MHMGDCDVCGNVADHPVHDMTNKEKRKRDMIKQDPRRFSHEAFDRIIAQTIEQIRNLSALKGGEYAGDEDRLANFRRNAASLGLDYRQIWAVYSAKHWDALVQYIKDVGAGTERRRLESLEGRCDDLIVYLLLFKAMLKESTADRTIFTSDPSDKIVEPQRAIPRTISQEGQQS